ncbi:diguanylate cyclase [Tissierella carlieri]|uniref:GGDEF domain-containing protein n=1 Tax=Tissierella carlieri TaxID=689904 RepID=A0ABT1SBN8_9FIRM|nr:diguanylate cyclase [Tissierella carlieri]MCQ4923904.1 GGDEF domain-containing protein [Tissierella carlieri]MDU5082585.1 GGDEF domain-containing protein [Bacillota bacterium]
MAEELSLKKYDNIKFYFKILIALWFVVFLSVIIYSNYEINFYVKDEVGSNAIILATYIANSLKISNEDYLFLKSLTFKELLESEINKDFEEMARTVMDVSNYKYIYIISRLEGSEKKYNNDVIYLLDAVDSVKTRREDAEDKNYYDDEIRYDIADELFKEVEKTKIPSYKVDKYKGAERVYAYVPFYTVEGNYIGLLGVDTDVYELGKIRERYVPLITVYIVINLMIGLIAFALYRYMRKVHNDLKKERHLSGIDELTHVFNRRKFNELFIELWEQAKEEKQNISIMLIDLDYFKEFNDNYGHSAGDVMLKNIGEILEKESSKYGGYVFRYGGDEFVILFPDLNIIQGEEVGNTILKAINDAKLEHPYSPIGKVQTVSIGVTSTIPKDEINIKEFFNYADTALYLSKRYGRNRVSVWKI